MKKFVRIQPEEYIGIQYNGTNLEEIVSFFQEYDQSIDVKQEKGDLILLEDGWDPIETVEIGRWILIRSYNNEIQIWEDKDMNQRFKEVPDERND